MLAALHPLGTEGAPFYKWNSNCKPKFSHYSQGNGESGQCLDGQAVTWSEAKRICSDNRVHVNSAASKFIQTRNTDKVLGSQYTSVLLFIPNIASFTVDYQRLLVSLSRAKVSLVIMADLKKFATKGKYRKLIAKTIEETKLSHAPKGGGPDEWTKDIVEEYDHRQGVCKADEKAKEIIDAYDIGFNQISQQRNEDEAQALIDDNHTDHEWIPQNVQSDISVSVELPQGIDETGEISHIKIF